MVVPTSHGLVDIELARSEGASLFDRGSDSRVTGDGALEDDEDVLGAVGRPRRDHAAIFNAQRLRGACDQMSVGRRPLWTGCLGRPPRRVSQR